MHFLLVRLFEILVIIGTRVSEVNSDFLWLSRNYPWKIRDFQISLDFNFSWPRTPKANPLQIFLKCITWFQTDPKFIFVCSSLWLKALFGRIYNRHNFYFTLQSICHSRNNPRNYKGRRNKFKHQKKEPFRSPRGKFYILKYLKCYGYL